MSRLRVALLASEECGACGQALLLLAAQLSDVELVAWPPTAPVHLLFLAGKVTALTAGDLCDISQYAWKAVALGSCATVSLPRDLHLATVPGCPPEPSIIMEAIIRLFTPDRN